MKHSHYKKPVRGLEFVDVYRVLELFGVTDQAIGHAIKKLLCPGQRGSKTVEQDVQEAIDTLMRWQEMRGEDAAREKVAAALDALCGKVPDDFGQQNQLAPSLEPAAEIDDESERQQAIAQNGNTGEHYHNLCALCSHGHPKGVICW